MSKICECCGNKNNSFVGDPFYLTDDKILCYKCAKHIRNDFFQLYCVKSGREFEELANNILKNSQDVFDEEITRHIYSLVCKCREEKVFPDDFDEQKTEFNSVPDERKAHPVETASGGMFNNIGGKIKTLATIITWIGIVCSVIAGFSLMLANESLILLGVLIAVLGSLGSWISSFLIYGFGQLIENSDKIA